MFAPCRVPEAPLSSLSTHGLGLEGEYINDMDGLQRPLLDVDCVLLAGGARGASTAERLGGCGGRVCTSWPCWLAAL
jgi:hypothetical protein